MKNFLLEAYDIICQNPPYCSIEDITIQLPPLDMQHRIVADAENIYTTPKEIIEYIMINTKDITYYPPGDCIDWK